MSIKNTGQFPHTQHYYPSTINDLPIPSDIGDKSFIFVNGVKTPYIYSYTGWIPDTPDPTSQISSSISTTLQNAVSATGNGTDFTVDGYGVATLQITGTFVATVTFYGSVDGTNFVNITAYNRNNKIDVLSTTNTGLFEINCNGLQKIRAVVTWTSGTSITIVGKAESFVGQNNSVQLTGSIISDTDKSNFLPTKTVIDRTVPVLLRTITTNDVLDNPSIGSVSGETVTGGSLISATTYRYSVCAVNIHGTTVPITSVTSSPGGSNNALRLPISQVPNATGYIIFLSTDTQPKMVLQVTEAQRVAGGICTEVYTYTTGGVEGAIDIGVVGTGVATNAACFAGVTAYTPEIVTETIVNTFNKSNLGAVIEIDFDDYRISPYLNYIVAGRIVAGEGDWVILQGTVGTITNGRRRSVFTFGGVGGACGEHTVLIYGLLGQNISLPITAWYF